MLHGFLLATFIAVGTLAQTQNSTLAGDYAGMLGQYHIKLHFVVASNGSLTGTADNSDISGMLGMPCANVRAEGQTLSFTVPVVGGTWTGFVGADGNSLSGMWNQTGHEPMPLNFRRSSGGSQGGAIATPAGENAEGEVKWDGYVFKFIPGGNMVQVFQGGKLVGQIATVDGRQQVIALPGTDSAKLQKSYQDYQTFNARSHGDASPATTTAPGAIAGDSQSTPSGSQATQGFKASNGYVITSFKQEKSITEIHVEPPSIVPSMPMPATETVIKFDTGHKGSVLGYMTLGAVAGQGGTNNNSHLDLVWINGKTNTGTNKGSTINFEAFKGVMVAIHEYVKDGRAPAGFDADHLRRFDKAMEYKPE